MKFHFTGVFFLAFLCPTTHGAFTRLIDGETELIIASRSISKDEKTYAEQKGIRLIEKPIALDALVFIVNPENPVRALTTEQIQNIYTGKITRWSDVGGKEADIHPYMIEIGRASCRERV